MAQKAERQIKLDNRSHDAKGFERPLSSTERMKAKDKTEYILRAGTESVSTQRIHKPTKNYINESKITHHPRRTPVRPHFVGRWRGD